LIQKYEDNPEIIKEVYLIEAGENEKIIVPPGFGITSVNPEKTELILANWIGREVKNDYQFYEKLRGACYYLTENKKGEIVFEKNHNYKKVPTLVKLKSKELPEYEKI
ncbi:MAG: glucose-6-phosphate isomerase family protein, partial [Patescibacteria group bacterium]